jgi:hypothetical protein
MLVLCAVRCVVWACERWEAILQGVMFLSASQLGKVEAGSTGGEGRKCVLFPVLEQLLPTATNQII